MELWSSAFLPEEQPDWATCAIEVGQWRRLTSKHNDASRLIAQIQPICDSSSRGEQPFYVALGSPVQPIHESPIPKLYLPSWVLERLGNDGTGDVAEVKWLAQDAFPGATRIVLRPHDSAFYLVDAKEELERGLTRLGVLVEGTTVEIPLASLGGYTVTFDVVKTEPANIVLAHGEEVAIEFEEAWDAASAVATTVASTEPLTPPLSTSKEADYGFGEDTQMIPGLLEHLLTAARWPMAAATAARPTTKV